jgi:hypothetical protein
MRPPLRLPLACALLLTLPGVAPAENDPITITDVRLGLPPRTFAKDRDELPYLFKAAAWAPVWVVMDVAGSIDRPAIEIGAETPDGDDVITSARVTVSAPRPGHSTNSDLGRLLYLKPGGINTDITVTIRGAGGKLLAEPFRKRLVGLPPARHLILSVGAPLPGLRVPRTEGQPVEGATDDTEPLRNGWLERAQVTAVRDLPDQWFGYQAVDLLVLSAGDGALLRELAGDQPRRQALAEWVRRGGRIIVGAGASADLINAVPELRDLLPVRVGPARQVNEVAMVLPSSPRLLLQAPGKGMIPLAAISPIPGRPSLTRLVNDERDDPAPLVVQGPYGRGRVTVVAFALDRPPLVEWRHREAYWEWLLNLAGTRLPGGAERPPTDVRDAEGEDEYLTRMQNNLEFFEGVPVVSFGWVALLILLYVLIIGPLEYLVLKRLFKRLEWTWLTFPVIVATACAAAGVAAYELKGRDLKVNKVDLVDIDLRTQRVYGDTWFTVFSPENRSYTVGVEPAGPRADSSAAGWVPHGSDVTRADTVVSWHGRAKSSRQSLFRRTYAYHVEQEPDAAGRYAFADGLDGVPVQVWSTKSFTASWSADLSGHPLVESTLRISAADPNQITGSITSRLPVEVLEDAQLLYRERATPLPPLVRGVPRYVSTSPQAAGATAWLQNVNTHKDLIPIHRSGRAARAGGEGDPTFRLWPALFHDLTAGQFGRLYNSSLRGLDESWRVGEKSPDEAILVARIGRAEGPAEAMSNAPSSPTRLWLGELPGRGPRAPLTGTLRQETYIRVFIPVAPAGK